jgi:hypothetical protein
MMQGVRNGQIDAKQQALSMINAMNSAQKEKLKSMLPVFESIAAKCGAKNIQAVMRDVQAKL